MSKSHLVKSLIFVLVFSYCAGKSVQQEYCPRTECSINAMWSQWAAWSSCSKECSSGVRTRARTCPGEKGHPSVTCGEERVQSEPCNAHACNTQVWSKWGKWSKCSNSNTNKQVRKRECIGDRPKKCPGKPSPSYNTVCPVSYFSDEPNVHRVGSRSMLKLCGRSVIDQASAFHYA